MWEWIRFGLAVVLLLAGVFVALTAVIGVFRLRFVLNRMHAAAMLDTLAILFVLSGLMLMAGASFVTLKLLLVIVFLWLASPVSSHLISRLEVTVDEQVKEECEEITLQ